MPDDAVGRRVGEDAGLPGVERLRLVGRHVALRVVGVALGPDRGADHERAARLLLPLADLLDEAMQRRFASASSSRE